MWLWFLLPRDRWSQEVLSTSFTTSLTCFINLFNSHNLDQLLTLCNSLSFIFCASLPLQWMRLP